MEGQDLHGRVLELHKGDVEDFHPIPAKKVIEKIAKGHAGQKHLDEFDDLGVEDIDDLADLIDEVVNDEWSEYFELERGREAYYNREIEVLVIVNPKALVFP